MEDYSASKRKKIITHAATWVNLEDMMPSERASHKRSNTVCLHLDEDPSIIKFIETDSRML